MPIHLKHTMKITGVVVLSDKLIKKGQPAFLNTFFKRDAINVGFCLI